MVVFGFSFGQGSFRASGPDGRIHEFSVDPPPEGGVDATLAAIGIPLYVADLRGRPRTGQAADWLRSHHLARFIGAAYNQDWAGAFCEPTSLAESYDAIFFVERTSAAKAIHD